MIKKTGWSLLFLPFLFLGEVFAQTPKVLDSVVVVAVTKPSSIKEAIGTGLILTTDGKILTARHVLNGFKEIKIRLRDETTIKAKLLFEIAELDLAVLQITTAKTLLPVKFGKDIELGEKVLVVGHPFGYLYTVNSGIVSGLNREIEMPTGERLTGLIQTDAAINPGNSGGPLINARGEVIGVVLALRQDAQSIGFALHVDVVRKTLESKLK